MYTNKNIRSSEQAIIDLINFCKQNGKYPNQNSDDPYEKSLAVCISNFSADRKNKKRGFSDEQLRIVFELQLTYSSRTPKMTPNEKIKTIKSFCITNGHWPSQSAESEYERKVYANCCRDEYYKDPVILKEYNDLKEAYLVTISPEKILEELRQHIGCYGTTPRENSKNDKERKLARNIKYLKSAKKFNSDQSKELKKLYDNFGPRGGTSIHEQILYCYLQATSNNALVSNRNKNRHGVEVDILIENTTRTVAVFYDGAFFHQDEAKDNGVNRHLSDKGIVVIRFREEGCPELKELNNLFCVSVPKDMYYQDFLLLVNQYFRSDECPVCDIISTEEIDNEEVLSNACIAGSSRYLVRGHLLSYIENALINLDKPKNSKNCKSCYQRKKFTDKESLLYAFVKRLFDSAPRKKRNIDTPSTTNDDIELLSHIIESIYKNTPYDHSYFKDSLITKINDML